jgi:pantoate--beta-alanine ligase
MSSRNARLSHEDFGRAAALHRALLAADTAVRDGERDPDAVIARATHELSDGIELEYFELRSADTLLPVERIEGRMIALVAARVGGVRLIDNVELAGAGSFASSPGGEFAAMLHSPDH